MQLHQGLPGATQHNNTAAKQHNQAAQYARATRSEGSIPIHSTPQLSILVCERSVAASQLHHGRACASCHAHCTPSSVPPVAHGLDSRKLGGRHHSGMEDSEVDARVLLQLPRGINNRLVAAEVQNQSHYCIFRQTSPILSVQVCGLAFAYGARPKLILADQCSNTCHTDGI